MILFLNQTLGYFNKGDMVSEFEKVKSSIKVKKRDLLEEQEMIANLHKYHMALQNVNLSPDLKKFIQERKH